MFNRARGYERDLLTRSSDENFEVSVLPLDVRDKIDDTLNELFACQTHLAADRASTPTGGWSDQLSKVREGKKRGGEGFERTEPVRARMSPPCRARGDINISIS